MTKYPMTKEIRMTNDAIIRCFHAKTSESRGIAKSSRTSDLRHLGFVIPSSLGISSFVIPSIPASKFVARGGCGRLRRSSRPTLEKEQCVGAGR